MMPLLPPLWAVHIGDGQITPLWCAGGFVVAGLLALWGAWRIREEEIPQLAVLTAAFFLTALIHVPVPAGPRTHLLLNGLLGVVLGRRAILAVLVGLFLQSSLSVMEGVGFGTLGVNACVMAIPAFVAWGLFAGLHRLAWIRHPLFRAGLIAFGFLIFALSLCYAFTALISNYGTVAVTPDLTTANRITFQPLTLTAALLLASVAAWIERRLDHAVEFPLGLLIGESAVLLTILLNGLVLLWGGMENWNMLVLLTFVIHLPLAVVEGIILGFTVGFLARVKPQLLHGYRPPSRLALSSPLLPSAPVQKIVAVLFAPLLLFAFTNTAFAHRLEAEYRILPDKRIQIESWFDITGDSPNGAKVRVEHADGTILTEGILDAKGLFVFPFAKAETLKVQVNAGQGHAKELLIPERELANAAPAPTPVQPFADRTPKVLLRDIIVALAFIFGLAAFVLSLRNARTLRDLRRRQQAQLSNDVPPIPRDQRHLA
jgi:cobalt/nickel transport system permease protein